MNGRVDLLGRQPFYELDLEIDQHVVRTEVHGERSSCSVHRLVPLRQIANAGDRLGVGGLAQEQPLALRSQQHGGACEHHADGYRSGPVERGRIQLMTEKDPENAMTRPSSAAVSSNAVKKSILPSRTARTNPRPAMVLRNCL